MKEQNLQLYCQHSHGGVPIESIGMKVETKEGEGSIFIIGLPILKPESVWNGGKNAVISV